MFYKIGDRIVNLDAIVYCRDSTDLQDTPTLLVYFQGGHVDDYTGEERARLLDALRHHPQAYRLRWEESFGPS